MSKPVNRKRVPKRTYTSAIRQSQAARTRALIVNAAAELFTSDGYAQTTVRSIADRAGVAADTVYATFGSKVRVLTAVIDSRLAPPGTANVTDRPEATAVRDEPDQRRQVHLFARDIAALSTRVRPIYEVLRTASAVEPEARAVYAEMEQHRLANMRRVASWVAARGRLAVDRERAARTIWAVASPDVARMLCDVEGWSERQHAAWLEEVLVATLLPVDASRPS
ncbi:MAG TPA: TetR/AcrR family transcriptional regulator [Streptomyces sp.]|nr:TetR/AcrR family transcriptional regulator [Streptomyces sp.]